jgi:NADH dehydrogenase
LAAVFKCDAGDHPDMNVLVTGGTGFVGTALCEALAERGHDVTALARTPEDADLPDGVATVAGDVTDRERLDDAFEGQDVVVHLVALSPLFKPEGGKQRYTAVNRHGTENVVDAAEEHDLERIVQMSALGADPDSASTFLRSKGRAEEVVRGSDLDWVITRPSVIFGEGAEIVPFTKLVTTPYVTGLPGGGRKTRFQLIWIGDLAPILADCAEDDAHVGEVYEFGGPEQHDLAELTELVYRAEGKSVTILPVPMPLTKVGLNVAEHVPMSPLGSDQYHGLTLDNTPDGNDVDAFGVDPAEMRTFEGWLGLEDA